MLLFCGFFQRQPHPQPLGGQQYPAGFEQEGGEGGGVGALGFGAGGGECTGGGVETKGIETVQDVLPAFGIGVVEAAAAGVGVKAD